MLTIAAHWHNLLPPLYFTGSLPLCSPQLPIPLLASSSPSFLCRLWPNTQMGGDGKIFTLAEVSQHNTPKDCWLIINGKDQDQDYEASLDLAILFDKNVLVDCSIGDRLIRVYNVTEFLEDHPGGDEVLLSGTGKDATDDFEDVGHSDSARETMNKYYVGEIDISTIPEKMTYSATKQPHYNQDKTTEFIVKLLQFLVPLAILGLAVGIRFYTKST